MPSLAALREHQNAAAVMAAGRRHRDTVTTTLIERLTADGALSALDSGPGLGEPVTAEQVDALPAAAAQAVNDNLEILAEMGNVELPDLDNFQRLGIAMIAFYTVRMLAADEELRQERQQDWVARRRRDEAAADAYDAMVRMRKYVAGVLDEAAAASLLDLDGDTPRNPFHLRGTLSVAVQRLRKPETFFPEARFKGAEPDWGQLADELESFLVPLNEAIRALEDEKTAAEEALAKKRLAFELHRSALSGWRTAVQGLAIAAGNRELANRFRLPPTLRRTGETDDDDLDDAGFDGAGFDGDGLGDGDFDETPETPADGTDGTGDGTDDGEGGAP